MANILVSLISEQTIPNVLLIKELSNIDKHLFVSTNKMETVGNSMWIRDAAGIPQSQFQIITVIEDSLADIEEKLRTVEFDDNDIFFVNLTGGTKIMSIGVYNFFRNKQSQMFYIPIGKNVYRKIFPEVKNKEIHITYRLGIQEYLTSYGIDIVNKNQLHTLLKSSEETRQYFQSYVQATNPELDLIDSMRAYREHKKVSVGSIEHLEEFLQRICFDANSPGTLQKAEIKYLTGEWFEEYVYALLKTDLQLDDRAIAKSVHIQKKNTSVQNEFDVMFTVGNTLHVIECKTSVFEKSTGRSILNETLYKLAALRKDFGIFAQAYIFTLSERGTEKGQIKQTYIDRSDVLNIKIVDGILLKEPEKREQLLNQIKNRG